MTVDFNHGSGFVYGRDAARRDIGPQINAFIDAVLEAKRARETPRDYLGASRIGEPCARRLCYEVARAPKDEGHEFDGRSLRIFDAGHQFEALSIRWLRQAGFELRTHDRSGAPFGFQAAGGRLRGHIDGVIVAGPDLDVPWPVLFEHKAVKTKSWTDIVKRGVRASKPVYFAQVQLYMAYLDVGHTLFTALNKDTQELHHELVAFDPREAQALSDKAVDVLRAVDAGELLPRIAAHSDFHLCRMCPYARRCWERDP